MNELALQTRLANMSKSQALRDLVMERLVVAADEIFALFERTFAEYEEEVLRSKHLQQRRELHKEDAEMPTLCPEVTHSPPAHLHEEPPVCVKQEEDQPFDYPAPFSVKSEAHLENSRFLQSEQLGEEDEEEEEQEVEEVEEEEGGPIEDPCEEEEPGCSMDLHPDRKKQQNDDTDDSEDWRPSDKRPPKTPALKKSSKRGRPPLNTNALSEINAPSERSGAGGVSNGGKKKSKQPRCSICGRAFSSDLQLKKHMLAHCGQRLFKCQVCDKGFRNRANFQKHLIIHEDEKPFICPACQRGFSQKCHLQAHMRIHTGEKPFSCPDCGVRFRYQRNIYRHITAVHKGEKPFSCPFCDKAFSQKSPFIVHMRTHTGEKPFSCSVCKKGFIDNCHLKKHAKIHEMHNR